MSTRNELAIEAWLNQALTHGGGPSLNISLPFTTRIMQEIIPANFSVPHMESYDGSRDLLDHLESFQTLMLLHQAFNVVLYHAFPLTLRGTARY